MPATIQTIHLIGDNARAHTGKQVQAWLTWHPSLVMHFTLVHCAWLNQVESRCSILQRKRLRIVDFASTADLQTKLQQFRAAWNERAHPFRWTTKSASQVMAGVVPAVA